MDARVGTPQAEAPLGELFGQLADDGKAFVRAEAGLYKEIARYRIGKAKNGAIALVAAALLANAALVVVFVGLAMGIAVHLGPVLGGLISAAVALALAGFLGWWGAGKLSALGGDAEERAALAAAERLP
jgi:hypothetical protein